MLVIGNCRGVTITFSEVRQILCGGHNDLNGFNYLPKYGPHGLICSGGPKFVELPCNHLGVVSD